ncbi:MAG: DNA/RNA nuclease SfsA [Blautia sp.]|nr:DNA/RNA nuclease SfsA [Blautia sp.]MDY5030958.1 DNA/RNA nuclease SfsA [Blautia sp.]
MKYKDTKKAVFLSRPNRFIAQVMLQGREETVHVKNTGRCRELLIPGAEVILEESRNPARKTRFDLICVKKENQWVNIDSQMPNKLVREWLPGNGGFSEDANIRMEKAFGNSRFDLYVEDHGQKVYIEVKGVTLEENHTALFPDAPTLRGIKHIEELIKCKEQGYGAWLIFVIQMGGVRQLEPNWKTHPQFGQTLRKAAACGVKILAVDCQVGEKEIVIRSSVPVNLEGKCENAD